MIDLLYEKYTKISQYLWLLVKTGGLILQSSI